MLKNTECMWMKRGMAEGRILMYIVENLHFWRLKMYMCVIILFVNIYGLWCSSLTHIFKVWSNWFRISASVNIEHLFGLTMIIRIAMRMCGSSLDSLPTQDASLYCAPQPAQLAFWHLRVLRQRLCRCHQWCPKLCLKVQGKSFTDVRRHFSLRVGQRIRVAGLV